MKLTPLLLALSVLANLGLAVVLTQHSAADNVSSSDPASASAAVKGDVRTPGEASSANSPSTSAALAKTWSKLQSGGSLPDLVTRLRAAGFPTAVIRAIIQAQVREQFAAKRKEIFAAQPDVPFWQVTQRSVLNPKLLAASRELSLEQTRVIKEALGNDASDEDEMTQYFHRRQFGNLSADKREQLQRITGDYSDLRSEIFSNSNGAVMPEDREQLSFLEKEMHNDFAKVLTPEELLNYDLRSGSVAQNLRSQLSTFQPTEQEFRALFAAAQSVENQFGTNVGMQSAEQFAKRQAAMNEAAKKVLPPDRYASFEQATDPKNSMLNRVVARYGLSTAVVPQVTAIQQDIVKRSSALRNNRELPADQRSTQLAALATEANARLLPLLGEKGFTAYKQYGGNWLQSINPPTLVTRPVTGTTPTKP